MTYPRLVGLVVAERLAELVVARRNARWSRAHGAREAGARHYPLIVLTHVALLAGCLAEPRLGPRPARRAVAGPALVGVVAAQALRWWCIATLGRQWNTRILVVPGAPAVRRGPYRRLGHPNYLAVVVEGVALPLAGGNVVTATAFTAVNSVLLRTRIRAERAALADLAAA